VDVSLYKDEAQLTKKKGSKKNVSVKRKRSADEQLPVKKSSRLSKKKPSYDFGHSSSESDENDDQDDNSNKKKSSIKKVVKKKVVAKEPAKKSTVNVSKPKTSSRKSQAPLKPTYVLASVSSALKKREITATKQKKDNSVLEKKSSKKVEPSKLSPVVPLPSERSSKTRSKIFVSINLNMLFLSQECADTKCYKYFYYFIFRCRKCCFSKNNNRWYWCGKK